MRWNELQLSCCKLLSTAQLPAMQRAWLPCAPTCLPGCLAGLLARQIRLASARAPTIRKPATAWASHLDVCLPTLQPSGGARCGQGRAAAGVCGPQGVQSRPGSTDGRHPGVAALAAAGLSPQSAALPPVGLGPGIARKGSATAGLLATHLMRAGTANTSSHFPFNFRVLSLCVRNHSLCVRNHTCDTDLTFTSKPSPLAHWFACPPPCRDIQLRMCAVPVQRPLLEGLLRHCLAERWLAAAEQLGERGWWVDVLGCDS